MKGALAGIAIGGFTSTVFTINKTVVQTLWRFNCLAADTTWVMTKSAVEWITQIEDDEDDEDDDDDENEDENEDDSEPEQPGDES